jgi:hypothetical protein
MRNPKLVTLLVTTALVAAWVGKFVPFARTSWPDGY